MRNIADALLRLNPHIAEATLRVQESQHVRIKVCDCINRSYLGERDSRRLLKSQKDMLTEKDIQPGNTGPARYSMGP